jgi:hypothetical protein
MRFSDLPPEKQEKAISDVFCIACQKSFRLATFEEREFRGTLLIQGKCPYCGAEVVKPVSTTAGDAGHRE